MRLSLNVDNKIMNQVFESYLRKRDLKMTTERALVLEQVLGMEKHFDVEELLSHIRQSQKKISRATVYRTLDLLVDCGLVRRHRFGETGWLFEPNSESGSHDHFLCISCGKIIEFYDPELDNIHARLKEQFNINIMDYSHQVYGRCKDCLNKN